MPQRTEQHACSGDECAVAAVGADSRGHREIGDVDRRVGRPEQQVAERRSSHAPTAGGQRRQIGKDEGEPERNRAGRHHRPIGHLGLVPVDNHPAAKLAIPSQTDATMKVVAAIRSEGSARRYNKKAGKA